MATRPVAPDLFVDEGDCARLLAARCQHCAGHHFPATDTCPYCGGACAVVRVGPSGTLRLFTVVRRAPPGYRGAVPYGFGVVALDDVNLEVVSRLGSSDLAHLTPGLPMRLELAPVHTDGDGEQVVSWLFLPTT